MTPHNPAIIDSIDPISLAGKKSAVAEKSPAKSSKPIQIWLYAICALIFAIVLVGGATRLTDSGLSITEWKPIHGTIPPLNLETWNEEFNKYRQIPEYQQINKGMSLQEFKLIYWWEWGHRQLGRLIGLVAIFGFVVFAWQGRLRGIVGRTALIPVLVGLQGGVGWWMVHSGLSVRTDVSQYRLASHLTLACIIFVYVLWLARSLEKRPSAKPSVFLKIGSALLLFLCLVQIALGGLVAGLDAGLAFNTWPKMDGTWWPAGLMVMEPWWLNFFENIKTVQFTHRVSAYGLLIVSLIYAIEVSENFGRTDVIKSRQAWRIFFALLVQAGFGVVTLLKQVPIDWALLHQGWAIVVLTLIVFHARDVFAARSSD